MRPGQFLCGCEPDIKTALIDPEGFQLCPTHGVRRYGWLSGPMMQTPNGRRAAVHRPIDLPHWNPQLGDRLGMTPITVEDIRDNRPAQEVGEELLARAAQVNKRRTKNPLPLSKVYDGLKAA